MTQMGFFDVENRYAALDAKHDPLVKINAVVPWEAFRSRLENVWRKPPERKSDAGRKPWDAIVMFKAILLCALYNLSDDQVEYQMRDRLSFVRFLGLALEARCRTPRPCGCTASSCHRPASSKACSRTSTLCKARATKRWAVRSLMRRLLQCPSS